MPTLTIRITERNLRLAKRLEQQIRGNQHPMDFQDLGAFAFLVLGNLLDFQERYGHHGVIELVVHDEGRRHYSQHTRLQEIMPMD